VFRRRRPIVGIADPFLNDAFVAQVFESLEDHEAGHEPDGLCRSAMLAVETGKLLLEPLPGDGRRELEQRILGIELIDEVLVEKIALVISGGFGLHEHSRPGVRDRFLAELLQLLVKNETLRIQFCLSVSGCCEFVRAD